MSHGDYCPICGAKLARRGALGQAGAWACHHCPEPPAEDHDGLGRHARRVTDSPAPPVGRRLADGFALRAWAELDDPRTW